jgi:predicted metal-dependent peptidase
MTPRQLLGQARVHTFEYVPYLASYIYSLREQETPGIGTAAVDEAGNLYWCPKFVAEIGKEQTAYLVAHEALHLVYDHHSRSREIIGEHPDEFNKYVCNVAGDLVIEQTLHMMRHLRPAGAVYLGCEIASWGIKLDFPENKSMQEYYRLILEKLKGRPQQQPDSTPQQQESSNGSDDSSDGSGDGTGDDDGEGTDDNADGQPDGQSDGGQGEGEQDDGSQDTPPSGAGSPASGKGEASPQPGAPGTGGSCADGQPRPYEIADDGSWETWGNDMAAAKAEEAIAEYEQQHGIGSVPGGIKQALNCKLRPQPDPFDQLRSAVCSSVASPVGGRDFSHRRRSRKQPPGDNDPLLHGRITVQPHAVVIVDTSGSMMNKDTMARALAVVGQGIRKLSRVKVFCADTHVRSHASVATTKTFDWCGGGGTNMARAIEEVDRTDRPDSIILITDAETGWPDKKPHARVVVAYTGSVGSSWHTRIPSWCRTVALQGGGNA